MPRVGFTGTQRGMTPQQKEMVTRMLHTPNIFEARHGDCIGADSDFHDLVREHTDALVFIHPPTNPSKRAFKGKDDIENVIVLPEKPYLDRNHDIVDNSDAMIACPGEMLEQMRSGTWATIRYARKKGVRLYIVYPDGSVAQENMK